MFKSFPSINGPRPTNVVPLGVSSVPTDQPPTWACNNKRGPPKPTGPFLYNSYAMFFFSSSEQTVSVIKLVTL